MWSVTGHSSAFGVVSAIGRRRAVFYCWKARRETPWSMWWEFRSIMPTAEAIQTLEVNLEEVALF